jgi:hypothetical protein
LGRLDAAGATLVKKFSLAFLFALCLMLCPVAWSHVGSPDVYYEAMAGPYKLFVTVRTPQMIPGIAQIEVRCVEGTVDAIEIVPLRVIGEGSKTAPPPDRMTRSEADPQFFAGKLWLMESGSWQVRMDASGAQGKAQLAVPVPAYAQRTLGMQKTTGMLLAALMAFLTLSLVSIFGAAARESQLEPGVDIPQVRRSRARTAMVVAAVVVVGILFLSVSRRYVVDVDCHSQRQQQGVQSAARGSFAGRRKPSGPKDGRFSMARAA